MGNGKEDSTFCTGGFRTTSLASPSSVKERKFLNDLVRCIWRQPPKVRQYESTPFAVCRFYYCMHMTFILERGSLRERSVDLCTSIAWLNIMLMYFYILIRSSVLFSNSTIVSTLTKEFPSMQIVGPEMQAKGLRRH